MFVSPRKKPTLKNLNIPIMILLGMAGGILLLVFLASSYLLSTNLSTNAVHKITDQVLTQSAKTAKQIFDEKILHAYLDLQALGMSDSLVNAAEKQDKQAISEALQNVYLLGSSSSVYNILFYQSTEDGVVVDESYFVDRLEPELINAAVSAINSNQNMRKITLLEYQQQTYVVMTVKLPAHDGQVYAALKLSDSSDLTISIRQQTKSSCVSFYNQNKIVLTSGEQMFCAPYFKRLQESNYLLKTVEDGTGMIRYGLSHLENFSDMDVGLVIPLDSIKQFESALWEGVYLTLLWMSGILVILLFMGSRLISRDVKHLIEHASQITKGSTPQLAPSGSYIKEFKVIANTFNSLFKSQRKIVAAEAANQAKGQFIANISHEIRTPINSIMNYARIMQTPGHEANQPRFIRNIFQSSEYLLHLINDLLDFSRIDGGYLTLEKINFQLDPVLGQLRDSVSSKAFNKNVEFILDVTWIDKHYLVGDPHRLYQILVNLCDNAIKFTQQGHVALRIRPTKEENNQVKLLFEIEDTGIGIRKQNQHKIFEVFSQEDGSTSRQFGGTGLGLSIVKQLVGLMGGEIRLESKSGKGSRFYFELPFNIVKLDSLQLDDSDVLKNTTTAVAVSNEATRKVMTSMLSALGVRYRLLNDEAVIRAYFRSNESCDIFIVDWQDGPLTDIDLVRTSYDINPIRPHHYSVVLIRPGQTYTTEEAQLASILVDKPITLSELHDILIGLYSEDVKQEFAGLPALQSPLLDLFKDKRVLVVDDNPTNQEITCILLERVGIITDVADSGRRCLEKIGLNPYDLVLMDVQMPEMDGVEATRNLRQSWNSKQLPIVGLSAHAMEKDRRSCLDAGMNDYLTKPLDPQKLYSTLKKSLSKGKRNLTTPKESTVQISGAKETLPAELPGIDIQLGLTKLANLKSAYRRVLLSFHKTHKGDLGEFEQFLEVSDWEGIQNVAHKLIGSSSSIGATKLCELCMDLETACLDKTESLDEQVNIVISELEKVLNGLSSLA